LPSAVEKKYAFRPGVNAMDTICDYLVFDHKRCDDLFTQVESSIIERNWKDAEANFHYFHDVLKQHIRMEEKVLFPAFEQAIDHSDGPVSMLRMEHSQIRGIVDRMSEALSRLDAIDFLLHSETFTILMQQHSMKEEEMLYPLLDRALDGKCDKIIRAMAEFMQLSAAATPTY
jgi:hemerythrin-like domain-containing protein